MDAQVHKICCVCKLDVSRLRRTKDPRGNYYCKPCYTTLLAARERRLRSSQARSAARSSTLALVAVKPKSVARQTAPFQALSYIEPDRSSDSTTRPEDRGSDAATVTGPQPNLDALVREMTSRPIDPAPSLPEFQLTALPASPYVVMNDPAPEARRSFSLGEALSKAAEAISRLARTSGESLDEPRAGSEDHDRVAAPTPVRALRAFRPRRIPGKALRLSDLISAEAQAEVEAARENPGLHEPEVPVSPITNLPVSALVDDYASLSDSGTAPAVHAYATVDGGAADDLAHAPGFGGFALRTVHATT